MKGKVYMQAYNVKKIDKHTKKEPTIIFWDEKNKAVHKRITPTNRSHR